MSALDFKFDLQLFADGGDDSGQDDAGGADDADTDDKGGKDDADDKGGKSKDDSVAIQLKIAEAVKKELAKARKQWDKEAETKAKEKKRLEKLSDDERAKAELEKVQKELADKEAELTRKELKLEMNKVLSERSIPLQFMDYLIDEDSESTLKRITEFEKEFKKAVKAAVDEKLKGKAPAAGGPSAGPGSDNGSRKAKSAFFEAIYKNQTRKS